MKVLPVRNYLTLLFLLNMLSAGLYGQSSDLSKYLEAASNDNPALQSAKRIYQSSMEEAGQAGALPDPQLSVGYFLRPMQLPMGNQRAELSIMQMFPWFGMNRSQRNEATAMAQGKQEEFRSQKNQIFYEIKLTWYELSQLQSELLLLKEELEIIESTRRLLTARLSSGSLQENPAPASRKIPLAGQSSGASSGGSSSMEMGSAPASANGAASPKNMEGMTNSMTTAVVSMADLLQIEVDIESLQARMDDLMDSMDPRKIRLNFLAGFEPETAMDIPVLTLPDDWEVMPQWSDAAVRENPMLQMNFRDQEAIAYKQRMARLNARPMFGLGINYMLFSPLNEQGMQMGGENMIMPMATMTLPIFRKKNKAFQQAADIEAEALQYNLKSLEQGLYSQWKDAERDFKDARRRINLFDKQIELTRQIRSLTINAYSAGKTGYDAVQDADVQLLALKNQKNVAIADWHKAMAKFEFIRGASIED